MTLPLWFRQVFRDEDDDEDDALPLKIGIAVIVLIAGFGGGLLPLRFRFNRRLLSLGNAFSGGVFLTAGYIFPMFFRGSPSIEGHRSSFLALGFSVFYVTLIRIVHMLGEATEDWEEYVGDQFPGVAEDDLPVWAAFPWTYVLACIGVFITLYAENVIVPSQKAVMNANKAANASQARASSARGGADLVSQDLFRPIAIPDNDQLQQGLLVNDKLTSTRSGSKRRERPPVAPGTGSPYGSMLANAPAGEVAVSTGRARSGSHASTGSVLDPHVSPELLPYILVVVLSIHSFIAGLALGIETDDGSILAIFLAIFSHKFFAAFALGVALIKAGAPRSRLYKQVGIFATMTPLGIVVGTVLSVVLAGAAEQLASTILQSLAAGTFIFVALVEVITHELHKAKDRGLKFLAMLVGFVGMSVVAIWT